MNTVIGMTWKELLRKKVFLMTIIMTILFLIVYWFIAGTIAARKSGPPDSFGLTQTTLIDQFITGTTLLTLGFFFGSFILAFLVIFSSFSSVSGEAETGMMQSTLTRPVARWKWYMGRWMGYTTFGVLYALVIYSSILVVTAVHANIPGGFLSYVQSFLLFAFTVPILVTLSLLGSILFSAIGNGVFMTMLYGAGWLGGMVEKVTTSLELEPGVMRSLYNITGMISLAMPVDALQRKMMYVMLGLDQLAGIVDMDRIMNTGLGIGQIPSNSFVVYAVIYMLILLVWGIRKFYKKDF